MDPREELLKQLAAEWENGAPRAKDYPKPSWMATRLEELGEDPMTDSERVQWCGSATVG